MPTHSNNYTRVLQEQNYSAPYIRAVKKHSRPLQNNRLPIILSLKHLAVLSDISYQELYGIVHRTANHYRIFSIKKKNGGKRWITVPSYNLMKLQRWINRNILYSNHAQRMCSTHATAYIKSLGHIKNAELHHNNTHIIKVDITRFFESISERQVFRVFSNLGYKPYVAFILARVCTRILDNTLDTRKITDAKRWYSSKVYRFSIKTPNKTDYTLENSNDLVQMGNDLSFDTAQKIEYVSYDKNNSVGHLPQGAPTSPMLANLVCTNLDGYLSKLALAHELAYTRYADDIVFSGEIDSRATAILLIREISKELRKEGFKINFQKTRYSPPGTRIIITGICINDPKSLRVSRDYKNLIRQEIYFLKKFGINEHCQRKKIQNPLSYLMRLEGKIRYIQSIEATKGNLLMNTFKNAVPNFDSLKQFYE